MVLCLQVIRTVRKIVLRAGLAGFALRAKLEHQKLFPNFQFEGLQVKLFSMFKKSMEIV